MHLVALGLRTLLLLAGTALLVPVTAVLAAPLDNETCTMLRNEQLQLEAAGVRDSMANDPLWSAANLPAARLNDIKRLIELDEQITFRCPPLQVVVATAEGKVVIPLPTRKPNPKAAVPRPSRKPASASCAKRARPRRCGATTSSPSFRSARTATLKPSTWLASPKAA